MSQIQNSRVSNNEFIDRVWQKINVTDGVCIATPHGTWDLMIFLSEDGTKKVLLAGQSNISNSYTYRSNDRSVVISFVAGAYMPHKPGSEMVNHSEYLEVIDNKFFVLNGHKFDIPTYGTAEEVVSQMVGQNLIKIDAIVKAILIGNSYKSSNRTVQRHFRYVTGLTAKSLDQITKLQRAIELLKAGIQPARAAFDAGYYDEAHLLRSLKQIMNTTSTHVDGIYKL